MTKYYVYIQHKNQYSEQGLCIHTTEKSIQRTSITCTYNVKINTVNKYYAYTQHKNQYREQVLRVHTA